MKLEIHPIHFSLLFHRIQDIGRGMKKINSSISRNVLKEEEEEKKRAYRGIICGEEFSFLFF